MEHRFLDVRPSRMVYAALAASVVLGGCGGSGGEPSATATRPTTTATTTATATVPASAAERRWQRQVELFTAGLLPALRTVQQLTGGGRTTGAFGESLDRRLFAPGAQRRAFSSAMATLARCEATFGALVPEPPTRRLRPARVALAHACLALGSVPELIGREVLAAGSAAGVDPQARRAARTRTREGVTLLVDGLTIVQRVLGD